MKTRTTLCVTLCALWLTGCFGPVTATKEISEAEGALERARIADAQKTAPYYYHSADEYLQKAKEEWGYSDFQKSEEYAKASMRHAARALSQAKEDPWQGSPVTQQMLDKKRAAGAVPTTPVPRAVPPKASDPLEIDPAAPIP